MSLYLPRLRAEEIDSDSDQYYPQASGVLGLLNGPKSSFAAARYPSRRWRRTRCELDCCQAGLRSKYEQTRQNLLPACWVRLANIPGTPVHSDYMFEARGARVAFGQRKGDYVAYLRHGRGAVDDVGEMAGRKKKGAAVEGDDSFDGEEYDEYDVDDLDDSVYDDSSTYDSYRAENDPDYPQSDEFNAYYNDDYKDY